MRTRATAAMTVLLLAALAACSDSDPGTADTKATPTKSATATTSSAPPNTPAATQLNVGETASIDDAASHFTVQVLAYAQDVKGPTPPDDANDGDVWAAVDAKICNTGGESFAVSQFPWSLTYADGTVIEAFGATSLFPTPEFPMDFTVKTGRCVRGNIPYLVPNGQRPERIVYGPDALPEPYEWTVPGA